ncbi:hypothetical protein RIR_jg4420.t1 [Rhizophagus irregularis DAOM 181602=DAOM 197198]|nr:hypothetical protein RIR_jg4420.t1 [Rhizophagus irregularis DAOM 181602=DAOM 197198]
MHLTFIDYQWSNSFCAIIYEESFILMFKRYDCMTFPFLIPEGYLLWNIEEYSYLESKSRYPRAYQKQAPAPTHA